MKKFVVMMLVLVLLIGTAAAEEIRTLFVIGFDFSTAEVLLEDEDGFIWTCPFGKNNWSLGEEYQLIINGEEVEIKTCEEDI